MAEERYKDDPDPGRPERPRRPRREDDEAEEPRPRPSAHRDRVQKEQGDRPQPRRRPIDDDEEEDRPRSRSRRDDDEDDERPRRRRIRRDDDDGLNALIPYKNVRALTAYYMGVFSFIPCAGLVLGPIAITLGILGLKYRNVHPTAGGTGHAWAGIAMGSVVLFAYLVLAIGVGIAVGLK